MEKEGHIGVTLLLGSGMILWLGFVLGTLLSIVMVLFSRIPDKDQYIPEDIVQHRTQTHSFTFALVIAFVTASTTAYSARIGQQVALTQNALKNPLVSPFQIWLLVGGAILISMVGHIATDMLTHGGGYKVKLFWPFSSTTYAVGLCRHDDSFWNGALLANGATAIAAAALHEFYYSLFPSLSGLLGGII